ncbi:MAG: hypothetical protein HQL01_07280 [Nitrospirae bacterium]|nr:hypothetical protein [Nitrospirota bacterium]
MALSKVKVTITMDAGLHTMVKEYCDKAGMKLSPLIERMLRCMLESDDAQYEECKKWALSRHTELLKEIRNKDDKGQLKKK